MAYWYGFNPTIQKAAKLRVLCLYLQAFSKNIPFCFRSSQDLPSRPTDLSVWNDRCRHRASIRRRPTTTTTAKAESFRPRSKSGKFGSEPTSITFPWKRKWWGESWRTEWQLRWFPELQTRVDAVCFLVLRLTCYNYFYVFRKMNNGGISMIRKRTSDISIKFLYAEQHLPKL